MVESIREPPVPFWTIIAVGGIVGALVASGLFVVFEPLEPPDDPAQIQTQTGDLSRITRYNLTRDGIVCWSSPTGEFDCVPYSHLTWHRERGNP